MSAFRFTVDGSDALEARVLEEQRIIGKRVEEALGDDFEALVLGGGYGRGEGAVCEREDGDATYNDYDYFVIVPHEARHRIGAISTKLLALHQELTPQMGIDVDFSKPIPVGKLGALPYELMWMELREGHYVSRGDARVLNRMPEWDTTAPPLVEGTRLYLNRAAGLIQSRQKLKAANGRPTGDDLEFVIRNIRKAQMCMGDSLLMVTRNYSPFYATRRDLVDATPDDTAPRGEEIKRCHHEAITFKLRPHHDVPEGFADLAAWHEYTRDLFRAAFLWFEGVRLGEEGISEDAYVSRSRRLETGGEGLKNLARNLKNIGVSALAEPVRCFVHPRDRLIAEIPRLVVGRGTAADEAAWLDLWERVN